VKEYRRAVLLAAALLGPAVPAGAVPETGSYPQPSAAEAGGVRYVVEAEPGELLTGVQVFVAAGLDRQTVRNSGIAALTAECILQTDVDGVPLRDFVEGGGGRVTYAIEGQFARFYLESRTARMPDLLARFAKALARPDFGQGSVAAARGELDRRIVEAEANPLLVGIGMFRRTFYANSNAGLPSLGTQAGVAGVTPADLQAFHAAAYRRGGVTISSAGGVSPEVRDALAALGGALPDGKSAPVAVPPRAGSAPTSTRIVTHRDIGAPWLVLGFGAPAPGSKDFGALLVTESFLSTGLTRAHTAALPADDRGVGALYLDGSVPASFVVYVNGSDVDPAVALREVLVVTRTLAAQTVSADALKHLKAVAVGRFMTESATLADRSYALGKFASQGFGTDYLNTAIDAIESVTPADLQRLARQYLQKYTVAIVLPREPAAPAR
jgi:zinc protease